MFSGAMGTPKTWVTSWSARCSMGISSPRLERQIERRNGRGDIEGHAIFLGQHRQAVGADFVGDVAIGGDAVRAHHHASDAAGVQKMSGHVVGDQLDGDAVVLQFPGGEARALQKRAGFVGENVDVLAVAR